MRRFISKNIISITEAAAMRLKEIYSQSDKEGTCLKLGVRKRGCNGLMYTMDYSNEIRKMDEVVEDNGVKIIVDAKAVMFVVGTTMDYVRTQTSEEFVFKNPNAKSLCGCGESFNV